MTPIATNPTTKRGSTRSPKGPVENPNPAQRKGDQDPQKRGITRSPPPVSTSTRRPIKYLRTQVPTNLHARHETPPTRELQPMTEPIRAICPICRGVVPTTRQTRPTVVGSHLVIVEHLNQASLRCEGSFAEVGPPA